MEIRFRLELCVSTTPGLTGTCALPIHTSISALNSYPERRGGENNSPQKSYENWGFRGRGRQPHAVRCKLD